MSQSDFVSRGQALVAAGQFQEAVKVCRLGLLGRPTTVEGRVVLGSALLALKRYDEVLAEMRVALELDHGAIAAHSLKAEALLKKGDHQAALDALGEAQKLAPNDPRIQQLVGEARGGAPSRPSTSHPAVGYIGRGDTKNYPNHAAGDGSARTPDPEASEGFTRPTALSSAGAPRRTPAAAILAVGDKSGTVEVDPELEGVQLDDDLDFDDLAAPPAATSAAAAAVVKRGTIKSAKQIPGKSVVLPKNGRGAMTDKRTPTMDLVVDDDSDVLEVDETNSRVSSLALPKGISRHDGGEGATKQGQGPGRGTAVRNAVQMPSGPIDISGPPPQPLPPAPQAPQRPSLAAALPTVAAMHPPQPPNPFAQTMIPQPQQQMMPPPAQRQTMIAAAPPPPPHMYPPSHGQPPPNWGAPLPDPRSLAAAQEPTMRPSMPSMDPQLQAMLAGMPLEHPSAPMIDSHPGPSGAKKTGVRKSRSKLQITLWILVGIVVIGGGVFAGFQIRAMRLKKQVAVARSHAMELAKTDTFAGWSAARDELSRIVQASGTPENQAALARARALIAYEFDDGVDDAKVTVEALTDKSSLDASIAQAYLALATSDLKSAHSAANAALSDAPSDPAANYLAGQVALAHGDLADAVKKGKVAVD
ncbi:MAG: tetratricopeptide repeat protein, partial [Kofleriaceae bacterium]